MNRKFISENIQPVKLNYSLTSLASAAILSTLMIALPAAASNNQFPNNGFNDNDVFSLTTLTKEQYDNLGSTELEKSIVNYTLNEDYGVTQSYYKYEVNSDVSLSDPVLGSKDTSIDVSGVFMDNTKNSIVVNSWSNKYLGDVKGTFINNKASVIKASNGNYDVTLPATVGNVTGDFINNSSPDYGGAINNWWAHVGKIKGNFVNNSAATSGGALYISGPTGNIEDSYFVGNHTNYSGGAIHIYGGGDIKTINADFVNNYVTAKTEGIGGAIRTGKPIDKISGNFIRNHVESTGVSKGGAIWTNSAGVLGAVSGNFVENYAKSTASDKLALGGALYLEGDATILSDNKYNVFSGNFTEDYRGKIQNAIWVDSKNPATLTLKAIHNGVLRFNDQIDGGYSTDNKIINYDKRYKLNITGDKTGVVELNNRVNNADIYLSKTNLNLSYEDSVLDGNNLNLSSGLFSMINDKTGVAHLSNLTISGKTNFVADVDLVNSEMDKLEADTYGKHLGLLNVAGFNMLNDAPEGQDVTEIYFAQVGLKDNVVNGVKETPTSYQTTAYTPIYKYNVMYDNREDAGYFLFTKGDKVFTPGGGTEGTGNPSDAFNPSVLSSPVAAQAGAYAAQNAAFSYAFQHADSFMPLPASERFAIRNTNRYAINETSGFETRLNDLHDKAIWVRPYTSFENIPLKNGPKVDTITYGTLVGGDSQIKELRNGWGTVFTGYMGYNGSSQSYSGVNTYQNGGLLGATQTFYKKNFFTALTASVGASAGESHNMYGHENFSMLMAGLASKTGYNIEFKEGKYILQPSLMLSYSFINTFDYRNSAGVKINSDPLHAIQIHPNIRFISNLKNGWQPYASVGMVWNILDDTKVMANDVRLPEMSVKPYVEYGLGVQKRWQDKFTGFAQAMVRNGGRNGIALSAGFRWALGKEGKPIEKVQRNSEETVKMTNATGGRKILKQLTQEQRTALGAKPQNTTRTTNIGVLKQL